MNTNMTRLESVVEGKIGHFYCPIDTPLHIAKEMIFQFQKYIGLIEDQAKAAYEAAQAEEKAKKESEEKSQEPEVISEVSEH